MTDAPAINDALRHWAIEADSVESLSGFVNDVYLVRANGHKYVLRCARRSPPVERLDLQTRFAEFLIMRGFPAAQPLRAPGGESCVVLNGVPWTLEAFIEGSTFDFGRIDQAAEAGRRLAEFEEAAEAFDAHDSERTLVDELKDALEAGKPEQLSRLFHGADVDDEIAHFSAWHARLSPTPWEQRLDTLPESWLHGDYHGRNMVFRDDEMAGLFDFDDIHRGPRRFDITKGIYAFSRERAPDAQPQDIPWSLEGRTSLTMRADFLSAFLDGYQTRHTLTAAERETLPFMAVLMWAPKPDFYESRLADEGMEMIKQRLRRDVRMMRGTASEMQRLATQFGWSE